LLTTKRYIAIFVKEDSNEISVYLPEIPELLSVNETREEAYEFAVDVLYDIIDEFIEQNEPIPEPYPSEIQLNKAIEVVTSMRQECGLSTPNILSFKYTNIQIGR
jgi:predicted RNase H-like HicB family nuclease